MAAALTRGPTNCAVFDMFWMNEALVTVTHGRGMFEIELGGVKDKEPAAKEPALRQELLAMEKADQEVRAAVLKVLAENDISLGDTKPITDPALLKIFLEQAGKIAAVDQKNRTRLKEIVEKHGWPRKSLVGEDGAHAAWLLVQRNRDGNWQTVQAG